MLFKKFEKNGYTHNLYHKVLVISVFIFIYSIFVEMKQAFKEQNKQILIIFNDNDIKVTYANFTQVVNTKNVP